MTAATRAVATRQEVVHADTLGSTVVTAEIPAMPVHRSYGVLLPDGSVWYPGSKQRLPAPWPLRFMVWVLSLVLLLLLAGLAVVEWHPSWLSALRHNVGAAPTVNLGGGGGGTGTTLAGGRTSTSTVLDQWSCTAGPTSDLCTLGVTSYTIQFTTTAACDVEVQSLPSKSVLYTSTQQAGQTHTVPVSGASTLIAYAGGATIKVLDGTTTLGTLAVKYDTLYTFQPAAGATGGAAGP